MSVAVVTDSTACLPAGAAQELGISVVPLQVALGRRHGFEGVDISPADVADALRNKVSVTTSRPSPAEFARVYRQALDAGAARVVSVHLSAALSGTWEAASLAAQDFDHGVVRVIDSRTTAMALGFAALAAARTARAGAAAERVQQVAVATADATRAYFCVDSLAYLRRGGRIGTATALLATSLSVKPVLQLANGRIGPVEKVRTLSAARTRLVRLSAQAAGAAGSAGSVAAAGVDGVVDPGPVDVAVQHLAAPERADELADRLRGAITNLGELRVGEIGAVLGAHLGPGTVGVVILRAAHG
ncbi:MAG: DegV family protein [Actinomycetia bacterium]|nr:DegV family protein [Actinomycetes bacterium]